MAARIKLLALITGAGSRCFLNSLEGMCPTTNCINNSVFRYTDAVAYHLPHIFSSPFPANAKAQWIIVCLL